MTINWDEVTFDVLCIETEEQYRPKGYEEKITMFLEPKGYIKYGRYARNTWYIRKDFKPSMRPGLQSNCFRGAKAAYTPRNESIKGLCGIFG